MKNKFILCGIIGWCVEILWTGFLSFRRRDMKLSGQTSIWMFPIYGMAVFLAPLCKFLKDANILIRGGVYTCCIFLAEFCIGSLLKKYHSCPWDYSHAKLNIKGLIRIDFAPLWFLTGLFFEHMLKKESHVK